MFMKKKASGTSGDAVQYVTRTDALRKLQLTLGAFRRLCILKGIHPREPRKKRLARQKTYYHVKDISFLAHEPLLQTMRELRVHQRRLRRAAAKGGAQAAFRVAKLRPDYRLDSLVRERYPSFLDALRDLDDPLTLVHLFASLPSDSQDSNSWRQAVGSVGERPRDSHELALKAASLALEWQAWVVRSRSLRAAFISVKGFYFRAVVQGTEVTWLVPHALSQLVPEDVDMGVMHTFLELYVCLLGFVHHRLYREQGLRYPPVLDAKLEAAAAGVEALMRDVADGAALAAPAAPGEVGERRGVKRAAEGEQAGEDEEAGEGEQAGEDEEASEDEQAGEDELAGEDSDDESGSSASSEASESSDDDSDASSLHAGDPASDAEDVPQSLWWGRGEDAGEDAAAEEAAAGASLMGGARAAADEETVCATLFRGLTFFLGREVPREILSFLIRAMGGQVAWAGEGSPLPESSDSITHQVVDRPSQGHVFLSREYVQPQWVFDALNARVLPPAALYAPGKAPPPHLSPFVSAEEEGYLPEYGRTLAQLRGAAQVARAAAADDAALLEAGAGKADGVRDEERAEAEDRAREAAERLHQQELEKELGGGVAASAPSRSRGARRPVRASELDEQVRRDTMLSSRARRAYRSVVREKTAKRQRVSKLERKAAQIRNARDATAA